VRVVVIADTHLPRGRRRLPEPLLEELRRADLVLHAGDVISAAALAELQVYAPLQAVCGNADEAVLRERLPPQLVVRAQAVSIGLVHDAGPRRKRTERLLAAFPGCAAIVFGHTHMAQIERHDGVWLLNPGSPTERRRAPGRSFLLLDVSGGCVSPRLVDL
jgi:putative phosphoesterase